MPHVIVKLWSGKSEQQKAQLAGAITKDVMEVLHYGDNSQIRLRQLRALGDSYEIHRPG